MAGTISEVRTQPRRELATRGKPWAIATARRLATWGITPNSISVFSVVFAALAGTALVCSAYAGAIFAALLLLLAAAAIQLRLLCNLLDGMVAIEGGKASAVGPIFNEVPDRIADVVILVCAGYLWPQATWTGWLAATLAVLSAYIRLLGGTLLQTQSFIGPMAKQHRMATLTVACVLTALTTVVGWPPYAMWAALAIIIIGTGLTCVRRLLLIARAL